MKKKVYFTLKDLLTKFAENDYLNIYDGNGYSINVKKNEIPHEFMDREVIKYKVDNAIPNIHFKIM